MHSAIKALAPVRQWRGTPFAARQLGMALILFLAFAVQGQVSKEYQIKAAFLYNFTKFVEWPAAHFGAADSPITIGVLAKNPFGDELQKIVRDRKVNGRALLIKLIAAEADATSVDLLFVTTGEEARLTGSLEAIRQAGVLTVGESEKFAGLEGIIIFVKEADKVRFEINQTAAEQAGLKISSQLLSLASAVRRKS